MNKNFLSTFEYKLIYIFRINDENHRNILKIGDATIRTKKSYDELLPNCHELNVAAKERIDNYTSSAGIIYDLLYTEIAVYKESNLESKFYGKIKAFRDYQVHEVLIRSGINRKYFETNKKQNEWFCTDLQTAINAIKAVKENKSALDNSKITISNNPIIFRPEQKEAIQKTKEAFKNTDKMLWNAKMRFGKTLSSLQVAKELGFSRILIITHRPVVLDGWRDDFKKIFYDKPEYYFASKDSGKKIEELLMNNNKFVYFISMQDSRGSDAVGGNFEKNQLVFETEWDFIIVDEAHEGTKTLLGKDVIEKLVKPNSQHVTKVLNLSGTPFNLLTDFGQENIYTWDYIMEQEAKNNWFLYNFGDSNPYEELPKLNIYTYHLEKYLSQFVNLDDKAFNFKEFFRVWTGNKQKDLSDIPFNQKIGDFVHEKDILSFLDLMCQKDENSNYPFSTEEYRDFFRHSLWILPGVKESKALSKLLNNHRIFGNFKIVNVAGDGDEEEKYQDALRKVKDAITDTPNDTYTITLSCGRLTTGVTVPEWTAVLMLSGTYSTAASQYLQTIFRVQTPANIDGKIKENCYVFDFAPDRTLKMIAEQATLSSKSGSHNGDSELMIKKFLNFCPVIAVENSSMKEYKVSQLLQELKKAYAERVVQNGFDDVKLYNSELLFNMSDIELKDFEDLERIIGKSQQTKKVEQIDINSEGFTNEQLEELKKIEKKPKIERTEDEKRIIAEAKKIKENRLKAISILRGISIRIPLLVYGIDKEIEEDITVDNFANEELIDDLSWEEFMPKDVTRDMFKKFAKYYDKEVFVSASRRIRNIAKSADELEPTDRVLKIVTLFSTFKNPDKETVLTPWKVVNLHMSETLGGYDFYDDNHENTLTNPRFVNRGEITLKTLLNPETNILEINSKTGLYPLYLTYSLYKLNCLKYNENDLSFDMKQRIWDYVVQKNIFVICKTPMAKLITKRTLIGYRNIKVNTRYFEDLVNQLKDPRKELNFISKLKKGIQYWHRKEKTDFMKFNAIVGNPPYQGINHQQIYPYFYLTSIKMADYVSLIFPTGWQEPKNANNLSKMNNESVKSDKQIMFIDNRQNVFPSVPGAEWINIILWNKNYNNGLNGQQRIYTNGTNEEIKKLEWEVKIAAKPNEIIQLSNIVKNKIGERFVPLQQITSETKPFGLRTDSFKNPEKYNLEKMYNDKMHDDDIKIYGNADNVKYVPSNYKFPKNNKSLFKYKVLVAYAWGNMSEKSGLGGAFSDIIIASPYEAATETYLVSGIFDDYDTAKKHAKYLMTKFSRALLYLNKTSQHSTHSWGAIPIQDYSEDWWSKSISEINHELFQKYNIPIEIEQYVNKNIQTKTENNIINYK